MPNVVLTPVDAQDHTRGPADAPLTLIEYGDFQCPYCADAHAVVAGVESRFAGRLRFVFRQFPLREIHAHAESAAEAAEAAGAQGRFWEMYDQLFGHSHELSDRNLRDYAAAAGVADLDRFARELADGTYRGAIDAALERGETSGVDGTPMFFINGTPFEDDPTPQTLTAALEAAL